MYVWNYFEVIACSESLLDSVLDRVNATITQLTEHKDRHLQLNQQQHQRHYYYDDLCLAMLIKGVCLRHKHNTDEALRCFHFISTQWVQHAVTLYHIVQCFLKSWLHDQVLRSFGGL